MKGILLVLFISLLHLLAFGQLPKLTMPVGHTSTIKTAVFSENGKRVLTASEDGTAKLWNAETGHLLANFRDATQALFSPHDQLIITIGSVVKAWDGKTGKFLYQLEKDTANGSYDKVFFTPDGGRMFTAVFHYVRIWNAASGKLIADCNGTNKDVYFDGFVTPDGKKFVNVKDQRTIQVWDTENGELLHEIDPGELVYNLVMTPNGKYVVNEDLSMFDIESGEKVDEDFQPYNEELNDRFKRYVKDHFRFNADGTLLLFDCNDFSKQFIWIYDLQNRKLVREISTASAYPDSLAFSPDEQNVISYDDTIKTWNISDGKLISQILVGYTLSSVTNNDKTLFVAPDRKGDTIRIWNASDGLLKYSIYHPNTRVSVLSRDKNKLITGDYIGFAVIWNTTTLKPVTTLIEKITGIWDISFDPSNNNFIAFTNSRTASVRDLRTGREINKLTLDKLPFAGTYSRNGKMVLIMSTDSSVIAWNTVTGKTVFKIKSKYSLINAAIFTADDKYVLLTEDRWLKLYELATGKLIKQILAPAGNFTSSIISADRKFIAAYCYGSKSPSFENRMAQRMKIFNAVNGKLIRSVQGHKEMGVSKSAFSNKGNRLAISTFDSLIIFDLSQPALKPIKNYCKDGALWKVTFSPDDKQLLTCQNSSDPRIWNAVTGKQITELNLGATDEVFSAVYSRDGKRILTASSDNILRIWDVDSRSVICQVADSAGQLRSAQFTSDETKIITWGDNQSIRLWDYRTCSSLVDIFATDENNFVYKLPNGSYMASPDASKLLHYVTDDLEVIGFDQLDLRFNRPDRVLQSTSPADTTLINAYYHAWQKRIRRLGYNASVFEADLSLPIADFLQRDLILSQNQNKELQLNIRASDNHYKLKRFNVWVNEVPVFGSSGLSLQHLQNNQFDTSVTIFLANGENLIETAVTNEIGIDSYRKPLFVKHTPVTPPTENVYFIGIGINKFSDSAHNLNWSVKDVRDLSAKLKDKYPDMIVDTLFDEHVTRQNILTLKAKLQKLNIDDKVIISYSGHGLLSKELDYYLSTYDVDFNKPEDRGVAYDELEGLLDNILPRKKLMLIDACHSGEVDKEEIEKIEANKRSLDSLGTTVRSNIRITEKNKLGMTNSFELMQNLFANVSRGTGATVISAAGGMQFAQERGDLRNGVFTYSIIDAFNRNKTMTVSGLKRIVSEMVIRLTNGLQKPTSRNMTNQYDWVVW